MSLREEYDQALRENNAQVKQKDNIQIEDSLLPQEVRNLYARYRDGVRELEGVGMYRYSLPIQLPPESRELIEELIDMCPPQCWDTPPDKLGNVIRAKVHGSFYGSYVNCYSYHLYSSPLQYRLSDGSVHVGRFNTRIEKKEIWVKPEFRLTQKGKDAAKREAEALAERQTREAVMQEAQQILEEKLLYNPMITGARESITISYPSSLRDGCFASSSKPFNEIFIFRDGVLYDPHPNWVNSEWTAIRMLESLEGKGFLRNSCSRLVKQWAANS